MVALQASPEPSLIVVSCRGLPRMTALDLRNEAHEDVGAGFAGSRKEEETQRSNKVLLPRGRTPGCYSADDGQSGHECAGEVGRGKRRPAADGAANVSHGQHKWPCDRR